MFTRLNGFFFVVANAKFPIFLLYSNVTELQVAFLRSTQQIQITASRNSKTTNYDSRRVKKRNPQERV